MQTLDFIHQLKYQDLPEPVVRMATTCLLDLIAVAAAGSQTKVSNIMLNYVATEMSGNQPILFSANTASHTGVALAMGTMIDSFDAHDGQVLCKGHVGVGIFPAIFIFVGNPLTANAELAKEIIVNMVIGYELGSRLGIALHSTANDYHTSGAWNGIAAAAIGARALKLSNEQTAHALGIAEYHGPRSQMMRCIDYPTMIKDGSGVGAMVGVSAALLAQHGFTGAPAITMTDKNCADIFSDLGQRWYILEQYFKRYPVCRWPQPAVEAALALRDNNPTILNKDSVATIKHIEIHSFAEAVRLGKKHPKTSEEAQYGLAFPFVCALLDGDVNVTHLNHHLDNSQFTQLIDKIELFEKAEFSEAFPATRWAEVIVHMQNGQTIQSPPTRTKGDFDNPYSNEVLQQKARDLLGLIMDNLEIEKVIKQITTLNH